MKKCLLYGTNNFSKMMRFYLDTYSDTSPYAFVLDKSFIQTETFEGLPVIAFEDIQNICPPSDYSFLLCLGYRQMNKPRKDKYLLLKETGYKIESFIHPNAVLEKNVQMGDGNIILEGTTLSFGTTIGNGNIIWNGCQVSHESVIGDFNYLSPGVVLGGSTLVTNLCFVGMNATIRGARIIGERTLIGANAFVNENTEPDSVYVPVRSICLKGKKSVDIF